MFESLAFFTIFGITIQDYVKQISQFSNLNTPVIQYI